MSNEPQQPDGSQWSSGARQPQEPQQPGSSAHGDSGQHGGHHGTDQRLPDIVDAEIVDAPSAPPATPEPTGPPQRPAGADEEEFRQYQKFLEFQRFQEWQRKYGEEDLPPPPGGPMPESVRQSWWKRALWRAGAKLVRRLIYLLVLLLVAALAFNWVMASVFGGGSDSNGDSGGKPGAPEPQQPILQPDPQQAIIAVYDYLGTDDYTNLDPGRSPMVCLLFTPSARTAFASAHDAPDCATAARRLHEQVSRPMTYKNPEFGEDAVQTVYNPKFGGSENTPNDAVVHSCRIGADGGPRLGDFGLRREANGGWVIDSYERASGC